jgi:hypothetical protein
MCYQIFWEVVGLERGPLSLVSTAEELLDRKVAAPVYKTETTAIGIRHADHGAHFYPQKLALTSRTSGGRSVGIVKLFSSELEVYYMYISVFVTQTAGIYLPHNSLSHF